MSTKTQSNQFFGGEFHKKNWKWIMKTPLFLLTKQALSRRLLFPTMLPVLWTSCVSTSSYLLQRFFFLQLICMWIIFLTSSSSFSYSHGSTAIVATVSVWNVYFVWNDSSVQVNIWDVTKHWDRKFQLFRPERNKIQNFYTHRNSRTNYKNPNSRAKKILDEML